MGALTLKSFPFELRGWDLEKFESFDPTDGFGSNTRVYINKNQIVQIEPDYNIYSYNMWLTDKGRQFFDGLFEVWNSNKKSHNNLTNKIWKSIIKYVTLTIYMLKHCQTSQKNTNFLTIVFENVSIEVLSLLNLISEKYSFVKIRRAEKYKTNNDLEAYLQINLASNKTKLSKSNLCVLISNNPRYEGYYLNLNLRQRFLKGDFKCVLMGSLLNLTFPVSFLGSNFKSLKTIAEGNNFFCQEIKSSKNPIIILNYELLKRHDGKNCFNILKVLKYANVFNRSWNGLNVLSPTLNEVGNQSLNKFLVFNESDLTNTNSLYFLNVNSSSIPNLKKAIDLKLLNLNNLKKNQLFLFLDQNNYLNNNIEFFKSLNLNKSEKNFKKYIYLPTSIFYENEETFINTEGIVKRTTKLIFKKETKNSLQIIKKIFKSINNKLIFLNTKDNNFVVYDFKKITSFKIYTNFQYQATKTLTNLNFYLSYKNQSFVLLSNDFKKRVKFRLSKLKYWLDDFFTGGKDTYSSTSLVLSNCSKSLRFKSTNLYS